MESGIFGHAKLYDRKRYNKDYMKRRKQKHLTEDEVERLKAVCETFSDQLIVYGILYTGMRVDELCHMHPGWINLRNGIITIPEEENGWHPKIVKALTRKHTR